MVRLRQYSKLGRIRVGVFSQVDELGWMQKLGDELWWTIISEYIHDEFEP